MDFERLERAWRSSANSPSDAAQTYLMEEMMETLNKRRRDFRGFITLVGLTLAAWTGKIIYDVLVDPFPFDFSREWAALPLGLLPWLSFLFIVRQHKRHMNAFLNPEASVPSTLRALIDENVTAQARVRWMAGMTLVCVLLVAIMLGQLVTVGKMTGQHVFQLCVLFGTIIGGIWLYYGWAYYRKLQPEGDRLRRLLAEYQD